MSLIIPAGAMEFADGCTTLTPEIDSASSTVIEIQGGNGVGKSSFLKNLARLASLNNIKFSFLGQKNALLSKKTLEENLLYFQSFYAHSQFYDNYWIDKLFLDKKIYEFSLGQQQKIALCTRLIEEYPLWILDEPCSHLDQSSLTYLIKSIENFCFKHQGMVIYSTHQPLPITSKQTYYLEQKCY